MAIQFTDGKFHGFNDDGTPLVGGLLYTYVSGTTIPQATYTDSTLTAQNTNPVVLDSRGEAAVWLGPNAYTMTLKRADGSLVWSEDGVSDATQNLLTNLSSSDPAQGVALVTGAPRVVDNLTALRALLKTGSQRAIVLGDNSLGDGVYRVYRYDSTDTTTTDNNLTVIVATDGGRWKLIAPSAIHGPRPSGNDDTAALTAAMNLAASLGVPLWTGPVSYSITQLVIPSGLFWYAGNTTVTQRNNTNLCALRNTTESFTTRTDQNIQIRGKLLIDCNGANQTDTEASGVLTTGVRFTGVDGLHLDIRVSNARRYGVFITNCRYVRSDAMHIVHNASIPSSNKDGLHINGNTYDVRVGQLIVENGNDDSLALNADDTAQGGSWTVANITGPIYDVHVDQLVLRNAYQGVRLLSATKEVANVEIGQIVGDVSVYAFNCQDYGLGTSSWYKNIRVGSISVDYENNPGSSTLGLVNVNVSHPNSQLVSDFWFGNIDRGQVGTTGANRETIQMTLNRTMVVVDRLMERYCSNSASTTLNGGGSSSVFHLKQLYKVQSAQSGGLWGCGVNLVNDTFIDILKIGLVDVDNLRNLVVSTNSHIGLLDVETFPVTNPTGGALYFSGASQIVDKLIVRNPDATNLSATFRYTLSGGATVTKEWPPYNTGTTAQRPTNATAGDSMFDMTLSKPIWWTGSGWVKSDGTAA
jgi:hypothetical protein